MVCILHIMGQFLLLTSASLSIAHYHVSELCQKGIQQINLCERYLKASSGNGGVRRETVMGL